MMEKTMKNFRQHNTLFVEQIEHSYSQSLNYNNVEEIIISMRSNKL